MLAATVCPWSTLREMTMPSIGAMIVVYPRLTFWLFSCARACSQAGLGRLDLRLGRSHVDFRGLELGFRNQLLRRHLLARDPASAWRRRAPPCSRSRSASARITLALCCSICVCDQLRIQPGDDLPLLDDRVEVRVTAPGRRRRPACRRRRSRPLRACRSRRPSRRRLRARAPGSMTVGSTLPVVTL